VTKCLGGVRLADGTLAGSTLTMDQALRNLVDVSACRSPMHRAAYRPTRPTSWAWTTAAIWPKAAGRTWWCWTVTCSVHACLR
jgi:hypothetical protein